MTEFASHAVRQRTELQTTITLHAVSSETGRCVNCDVPGPCLARRDATYAMAVLGELPRRSTSHAEPTAAARTDRG